MSKQDFLSFLSDPQNVFDGQVALYPDFRLRIRALHAETEDHERHLVAPGIWRLMLSGEAWENVKHLDPEDDLRRRDGFKRLIDDKFLLCGFEI